MSRKNGSSVKWLLVILLILGGYVYCTHRFTEGVSQRQSSTIVYNDQSSPDNNLQAGMGQTSNAREEGVLKEVNMPAQSISSPITISSQPNPTAVKTQEAIPAEEENPKQKQAEVLSNPVLIPTDDEVLADLGTQNQQRQAREQILSDRRKKIADVHQAIVDSGVLSIDVVKPTVPPLTSPPEDIAEKIRSHQLTAH